MGISNLFKSFSAKDWKNCHNGLFWPFQIYTSLFGKNCQKNSEQPFFAIPSLYQSFWENCQKIFGIAIFGHSKFIPVLFGKNSWKTFGMAIFGCSKFIPVFLEKIVGKNSERPFLAVPIFFLKNFLYILLQ